MSEQNESQPGGGRAGGDWNKEDKSMLYSTTNGDRAQVLRGWIAQADDDPHFGGNGQVKRWRDELAALTASQTPTPSYVPADPFADTIATIRQQRAQLVPDGEPAMDPPDAIVADPPTTTHAGDMPALPEFAQFDPAAGAGAGWFVDEYMEYARRISPMTPDIFHESAALWLAAVGVARRLKLPMPFGDVYPNVWAAWIARTTLHRKSTALDVAKDIARRAMPHLLLPQDFTPEALLSDLAGEQPVNWARMSVGDVGMFNESRNYAAQRGLVLDEFSGLLAGAGKDYNAGLVEAFLRFYDCEPRFTRSTRGTGHIVVKNAYLSFLGASTPCAIAPHMTGGRLWDMGFWPRFAILTPDGPPTWIESRDPGDPAPLVNALAGLRKRLPAAVYPDPPAALTVSIDPGAFNLWRTYAKAVTFDLLAGGAVADNLAGTYGRMPVQSLKIAILLAALDWTNGAPRIETAHMARALTIAEGWRASAHRAMADITAGDFERLSQRIIRQAARAGSQGATLRDLYRSMRDKSPAEIGEAVEQLIRIGELVTVRQNSRGPKTIRYAINTV